MPEKHREYLAANILSDGRIVTYRSLSRALKIHVNNAKECLYEFYQQENSKKPGLVHATYLLSGVRKPPEPPEVNRNGNKHDEDEEMQSSPFMSSAPQQEAAEEKIVLSSIVLVRQEDLESVRATFETITSIHIYSLQPHALKDLQVLSNANREIYSQYLNEDPIEVGRQYGTIINPNVKRRSGRGPPLVPPASVPSKPISGTGKENKNAKTEVLESSTKSGNGSVVGSKSKDGSIRPSQIKTETGISTKPPPMKRGSSNIFKAFAKAKPKEPREDTDSSAAASAQPSAPEDEPMKDASEEEQEEDLILPTSSKVAAVREAELKAKAHREEQLRQMMEVDDDEPSEPPEQSGASKEPSPENQPSPAAISKEPSPAISVPTKPGRRRGRRKVMKKITTKDEEGYLVTKEEAVWESFSEDEPQPQPQKSSSRTPASTQPSSTPTGSGMTSKAKKGKSGQGNIQSFFSKR